MHLSGLKKFLKGALFRDFLSVGAIDGIQRYRNPDGEGRANFAFNPVLIFFFLIVKKKTYDNTRIKILPSKVFF